MLNRGSRIAGVTALALLPVFAVQVGLGSLLDTRPELAWFVAVAFVAGVLLLTRPGVVLVAALPATYLYFRVGPASTDISMADVALAISLLAALPFVPWSSPRLRAMVRLLAAYLLVLAIVVVAVPSQRAAVEWGHRAFLVGGALFVGAAIAATGRVGGALRAYVITSVVVAFAAIVFVFTHPGVGALPAPAYPFGIQKNAAGTLLGFALIAMIAGARWVSVPRPLSAAVCVVLGLGIVACQARGPAIALVVVLAIWTIREQRARMSPLFIVATVLVLASTYVVVDSAFQSDSKDARYSSVNSRVATYDAAVNLWQRDPIVGVGLKFWRDPAYANETAFGEPHDLVVAALGESGVIGLVGLTVLAVGSIILLLRGRSEFAWLAVLVVVSKTAGSLVDIYWVAGTLTFMWIVVGFACASDRVETAEVSSEELAAVT